MMGTRTGFVHLTAHEWFTLILWVGDHTKLLPEPPTPPEPISNQSPDSAPDKTGNNRDTESEELNAPILPPPDSLAQPISNQSPDSAPDKTGNNRDTESEELNAPILPLPTHSLNPFPTNPLIPPLIKQETTGKWNLDEEPPPFENPDFDI
jgi:hypothetical protein